jgi:hypothetical protein
VTFVVESMATANAVVQLKSKVCVCLRAEVSFFSFQ